jgi:hypothetical protein
MENITEIFNKYGTDKGSHPIFGWEGQTLNYTEVYGKYFNNLRNNKENLEIKNYTLFNNNWLILIEK